MTIQSFGNLFLWRPIIQDFPRTHEEPHSEVDTIFQYFFFLGDWVEANLNAASEAENLNHHFPGGHEHWGPGGLAKAFCAPGNWEAYRATAGINWFQGGRAGSGGSFNQKREFW